MSRTKQHVNCPHCQKTFAVQGLQNHIRFNHPEHFTKKSKPAGKRKYKRLHRDKASANHLALLRHQLFCIQMIIQALSVAEELSNGKS
jgi:hypothetical protein